MPNYAAVDVDGLNENLSTLAKNLRIITTTASQNFTFPNDFVNALPNKVLSSDEVKEIYIASVCNLSNFCLDNNQITSLTPSFQNGNQNLLYVNLPELTTIGSSTFYNCKNLTQVNLPKLITAGSACFAHCESLQSLYLPSLVDLDTGNNSYGMYFSDCTSLEKIYLPKYTGTFGPSAFHNDKKLTTLILGAGVVCELTQSATSMFNSTPITKGTGYVYVPKILVESYKNNTNWSSIANQIRAIEDYPNILTGWEE